MFPLAKGCPNALEKSNESERPVNGLTVNDLNQKLRTVNSEPQRAKARPTPRRYFNLYETCQPASKQEGKIMSQGRRRL